MSATFSLPWIYLRCRLDVDTGCRHWLQSTNPSGAPIASRRLSNGSKPGFQMRRVVWERRNGSIPAGMMVGVRCGHAGCLTHLELITKAEVVRRQWTKPGPRALLTAAATQASRARAKLDMDKAREIRNSDETLVQVAARMDISITLASLVRRGERWKEAVSPFAGLGGRASNDDQRSAA